MKYRLEIDAFRAIAVLAVIIFHLNPNYLPGGFIGVDIFFVISGFLITSLIEKQIENNNFKFIDFYVRRIKRLLPLFFSVIFFSLIAGYFILFPGIYRKFAGDAIASNFFLANFKFSVSGNYFDEDKINPILHLWSLAVEEQFYLVFPVFYVLIYRCLYKYRVYVLSIVLIVSLLLAEYMSSTPKYENYSYFLLPTRMWELLSGCLLAITSPNPIKKYNSIISWSGMLLFIIGLFVIKESSTFPGLITLIPIIGIVFMIAGGNHGFAKILSNKLFLFLGGISYSLYMLHWPFIIYLKVLYPNLEFDALYSIVFIVILVLISYLSKKYIEDYFRYKKTKSYLLTILVYFIIPSILLTTASLYIYKKRGMPERYGVDVKVTITSTVKCPPLTKGCFISNNTSEPYTILLGDSHALHFSNLFKEWFNDKNLSLKLYSAGGCEFYSKDFISTDCENVKSMIKQELETPKIIIIAKRYDLVYEDEKFRKDFFDYVNNLTEIGHKVIIVNQVPKFEESEFLRKWMISQRYNTSYIDEDMTIDYKFQKGNETIFNLFKGNENIQFLDLNTFLIEDNKFLKYSEDNLPLYYNSNHLTAYGAEWIYNKIKKNDKYNWVIDFVKTNQ